MIKDAKLAALQEAAILKDSTFPFQKVTIPAQKFKIGIATTFAVATAASRRPNWPTTNQAPPTADVPPLLTDANFPGLPSTQQTTVQPPLPTPHSGDNSDLDATINKLERIQDLFLQIKTFSREVNTMPGLQGLFKSVLATVA